MEQEWLVSRIVFKHTQIIPAKLGNKAGLIGAASLFHPQYIMKAP
ncbi:hypothetical protein [Paenibacillus pabuli]|nr:hypothetical protein [Paenibacillus pabuli]MEC0128352.1 hypothetical protein [Paenibacillus pabuli]